MTIAHIYNGELGFDVRTKLNALIDQVAAIPVGPSGSGDVVGPAGAIADSVAVYNGVTGKLIKDGGATIANIIASAVSASGTGDVVGPAGAVADHIATYNGTTGKLIKDSGQSFSSLSFTSSQISDFAESTDDRVAALLVAGSNVTLTYNDPANTLTIAAAGGGGGGSTILNGSGPPAGALGSVGDYYVDEPGDVMYGPKTSGGLGPTENILGLSTPTTPDGGSYALGNDFNILVSGTATGARFWRYSGSVLTTRNLRLYDTATGTLLASASTGSETGSGWISVTFATPVVLTAPTTVSVVMDVNGYLLSNTAPTVTDASHATWVTGRYGSPGPFPTNPYAQNYFADLLWSLPGTPWSVAVAGAGIGNPVTSATAGSVLFAGAAGVLAQDNANFFFNDTTNDLKIGGQYYINAARAIYVIPNVSGNNWFEGAAGNAASVTGYANFGTGDRSLGALTSGVLNTAIGAEALRNTQADSYNVAVGTETLWSLGNGGAGSGGNISNFAMGYRTLSNLVTGGANVGIGHQSMYSLTDGLNNICIGNNAGGGIGNGGATNIRSNTMIGSGVGGNLNGVSNYNTWLGGFRGPSGAVSFTCSLSTGDGNSSQLDWGLTTAGRWSMGFDFHDFWAAGLHLYNSQNAPAGTTDYERAILDWNITANVFRVGTQAGGTGTKRLLAIDGFAKAGAPAAGDLPASSFTVIDDTSGGATWLVFNKGGTIRKVQLV